MKPCAVLILDRKETAKQGKFVTRQCGAPTRSVVSFGLEPPIFAACERHNARLRRAFAGMKWL